MMEMKRFICAALALLLFLQMALPVASAVGEINGTNDSGLLGVGSAGNYWTPGKEGIRVTVVDLDGNQIGGTVDYSNSSLGSAVYHFGRTTKMDYRNGYSLSLSTAGYDWKSLYGLPKVISENGTLADMDAIKDFISTARILNQIASNAGIGFEDLIDGNHKIVIEPIAYFYYMGLPWAMTATEAALYDQQVVGDLCHRMGNLTHKQLPLSMFLSTADLHFPSYASSGGSLQSRATIIERLGLMIWSNDKETPGSVIVENPIVDSPTHYDYHTDVDVYTAAAIRNTGGDITSGCTATLTITGDKGFSETVTTEVVNPANRYGYIWWKWHTPQEEQSLTMTVRFNKSTVKAVHPTITAAVTSIDLTEPPDPKPTDQRNGWTLPRQPDANNTAAVVWHGWVYGRQQISQPTTETVYYYNENPASKWSIWSSVVKVDAKDKIPTASGAYEVRDLTEQSESGYWGEWIGFEYEASSDPVAGGKLKDNARVQYRTVGGPYRAWSDWQNATLAEPISSSTKPYGDGTWDYSLQSVTKVYGEKHLASSYTHPRNKYASDCYEIIEETPETNYGSWINYNTWTIYLPDASSTLEVEITGSKQQSRGDVYTLSGSFVKSTGWVDGGLPNPGRNYYYKNVSTRTVYTYRTRSVSHDVWYQYRWWEVTGKRYHYRVRYIDHYYYDCEQRIWVTQQVYDYKYRYRKKIWTGSSSWSTGVEAVPAKVSTQNTWSWRRYTAGLQVQAQVLPDAAVKTVVSRNGKTYLKSGYGVDAKVLMVTYGESWGLLTGVQTAYNLFPEFNYTTYGRWLEPDSDNLQQAWVYQKNKYSPHMYRVHYTPLWYPDETIYPVYTYAGDCWTPGGELHGDAVASLWIDGNLYDDWSVGLAE